MCSEVMSSLGTNRSRRVAYGVNFIHLIVRVPVKLHDPTLRRLGKTLILKNAVDIFPELC